MNGVRPILNWAVIAVLLCPLTIRAAETPTSAEDLANHFEAAISAKDKDALLALVYWQDAAEDVKSLQQEMMSMIFQMPVKSVKLTPLPAGFQTSFEKDGKRYSPTLPVIGLIEVEYTTPGNSMQQPYGKKDGKFYLPSTKSEKIAGVPKAKDKKLSVSISISDATPGTFEGSCVYLHGGKEVTQPLIDKYRGGNVSAIFLGERIKSCKVRKTSEGGELSVLLKEDGKEVFRSDGEKTDKPIVYAAEGK